MKLATERVSIMSRHKLSLLFSSALVLSACTGKQDDKASLPPATPAPAALPETPKEPGQEVAKPDDLSPEAAAAAQMQQATESPKADAPVAEVEYRLTGQISSVRKSVMAFRATGFINEVLARPGTAAKKGDVIATLDDRDFALRAELANARKDLARVSLDAAQKEYQREVQLKKENASTATTFDKVKAAYDQANLSLKVAGLDYETAALALADTKLTAPYDCVVATQLKYDGENVQAGNGVLEVYDVGEPEITLQVPERLMGQVQVGSKLRVAVPAANYSGDAEITRMVPVISEKSRTFQVIGRLLVYDPKIVPGSYAEATMK